MDLLQRVYQGGLDRADVNGNSLFFPKERYMNFCRDLIRKKSDAAIEELFKIAEVHVRKLTAENQYREAF